MPSVSSILQTQIVRELQGFIREIEAFPSDDSVWHTRRGVTNSAGNLALHVCGNLQDFVGRVLGGTAYVRNREREFSQREGTRTSIVAELRATIDVIEAALPKVADETMAADYPMQLNGKTLNTATFLVHLASHLAFHLGQAGYLRRVVTGDNTSTNPLPVTPISR
ncbi:MAG: DinB family protein [Vicinamibacterales bacterium]